MTLDSLLALVLVVVRVSGLIAFLPLVGGKMIGRAPKVALVLVVSVVLLPVVRIDLPAMAWQPAPLILMGTAELLFGALMGLCARVVFSAVRISGELFGRNMGMAMAVTADPEGGARATVVGNFCNAVMILTFLALDGHIHMLRAVHSSFATWPVGAFLTADFMRRVAVDALSRAFVIGFQLAAPLLVLTFSISLLMALMARLAPQFNVLVLGFAVRLSVGMIAMILFVPILVYYSGAITRLMLWFMTGVACGG